MAQQATARTQGTDVRSYTATAARDRARVTGARLRSRLAIGLAGATFATLVAGAISVPSAEAAVAVVKVSCPGGKCSAARLQAAIGKVASSGTIEVGAGTYRGDISIAKSVTLRATGTVILNGQNTAGKPGTVITIVPSVVVTLHGFTVTGGHATAEWGGGIINGGTLTLQNMTIKANNESVGEGGGIYSYGDLVITGSTITRNTSSSGGGIANYGDMVMSHSSVTYNTATLNGGGVDNIAGIGATIISTTFSGNTAGSNGGAIDVYKMTLTIADSTLSGNRAAAGGAIYGWTGSTPESVVITVGNTLSKNKPTSCAGTATC